MLSNCYMRVRFCLCTAPIDTNVGDVSPTCCTMRKLVGYDKLPQGTRERVAAQPARPGRSLPAPRCDHLLDEVAVTGERTEQLRHVSAVRWCDRRRPGADSDREDAC